jgi:transposase
MPWKECHVVDERTRFVARLMDGETMTALCEEFGISRKTGYKIAQRFQQIGVRGLSDRSDGPIDTRISCRQRSKRSSSA